MEVFFASVLKQKNKKTEQENVWVFKGLCLRSSWEIFGM